MTDSRDTITSVFIRRGKETPDKPIFHDRLASGWQSITWSTFLADSNALAQMMRGKGLVPNSNLAILAPVCLNWELYQIAALRCGASVVGLDPHDQASRIARIMEIVEPIGLVVPNRDSLAVVDQSILKRLRFIITWDSPLDDSGGTPDAASGAFAQSIQARDQLPVLDDAQPESPAAIVFTSGSTGEPKGIAYSHQQVLIAMSDVVNAFPEIVPGDRMICWLPLSNLFQRMLNFCSAYRGAETFFVSNPREIMERIQEINPHAFVAVPRFYEKLHEGIEEEVSKKPRIAQWLFAWSLKQGYTHTASITAHSDTANGLFARLKFRIANFLVLRRIRAIMGSNLKFLVSGSAPLDIWLAQRFHALGWLILEAYGFSENIVPVSVNQVTCYKLGTTGPLLPHIEAKVDENGEILVRGPGAFSGYLGEPQDTHDPSNFYRTGDLGSFDGEFLNIEGRASEIFKTSTGRKIAPAIVESKLRTIAGVDAAVLVGANRKCTFALLSLADAMPFGSEELKVAIERVLSDLIRVAAEIPDYAQPVTVGFTLNPFSIESGELTSNLKIRRKFILASYATDIEQAFRLLEGEQPSSQDTLVEFGQQHIPFYLGAHTAIGVIGK